MGVEHEVYQPGAIEQEDRPERPFEEEMLERVVQDWDAAETYRKEQILECYRHEKQYRNARFYEELRAVGDFPVPIAEQIIGQFVATECDKLLFARRPCRLVGVEDDDKEDAEAKQVFMDWQDYRDGIHGDIATALEDCAVKKRAVAQVDFLEKFRDVWGVADVDVPDEISPEEQAYYDATGEQPPAHTETTSVKQRVRDYVGATVHMIDPNSVYWTKDKRRMADPFPIMVVSEQAEEFFYSKSYFINQEKIAHAEGSPVVVLAETMKEQVFGEGKAGQQTQQGHNYIEWQGVVKQSDIATFEKKPVHPGDELKYVWAICGVVDKSVVVRLHKTRHGIDGPNLVMGCVEGDPFRPVSVMDKIYGICKGADQAMGQMLTNITMNIDSMWGIDETGLVDKGSIVRVNERALVYFCNRDPRTVLFRLDQLPQTEPLRLLVEYYYRLARDAAHLPPIALGQGDPNAETLGESAMVEGPARLGLNAYLKRFEDTFVQPLYEMRNQINAELVDLEFRFLVLGDKAIEWRTIDPAQVRTNVDFICEAASRETNRAVQTQQLLNFAKLANEISGLTPVRPDLILRHLAEVGLTISTETIDTFLPLGKYEKQNQINVSDLLVQAYLAKMGLTMALTNAAGEAAASGPDINGPMTEGNANESVNQQNTPTPGQQV